MTTKKLERLRRADEGGRPCYRHIGETTDSSFEIVVRPSRIESSFTIDNGGIAARFGAAVAAEARRLAGQMSK